MFYVDRRGLSASYKKAHTLQIDSRLQVTIPELPESISWRAIGAPSQHRLNLVRVTPSG